MQQTSIDVKQVNSIGNWYKDTSLPGTVIESQVIVTRSSNGIERVYMIGGCIDDLWSSKVYTAPVNNDGTLGVWVTDTSLPKIVGHPKVTVIKSINGTERVYLLGVDVDSLSASTIYTAPIKDDGTLGAWSTSTPLPGINGFSRVIFTRSTDGIKRIYVLGGCINGSWSSTIYTAPINNDGVLGTWTTNTSLPITIGYSQIIVTKSIHGTERVYILGGYINSSWSSTVYTAPIDNDGVMGTWSIDKSLPKIIRFSRVTFTKSLDGVERVYIIGEDINNSNSFTLYTAPINRDGTLGAWVTDISLPGTITYSQVIITKFVNGVERIYIIGMHINQSWSSTVYTALVNNSGMLGTWTTDTSLPETIGNSQIIITKSLNEEKRIYALGGVINGLRSSKVYTAPICG